MTKPALVAFSLLLCACDLIPGYARLTSAKAENPLGGEALVHSKPLGTAPIDGASRCTVWPLETNLRVQATDERICVEGHQHKLSRLQFPLSGGYSLSVSSNGSDEKKSDIVGASTAKEIPGQARRVGTCTSDREAEGIWEITYSGCVANVDGSGKPVLTKTSTFLSVGNDARWMFPEGAPPPVAASTKP